MAEFLCPHCGRTVQSEDVYCPHCTRSLRLNAEAPISVEKVRGANSRVLVWTVALGVFAVCAVLLLPLALFPSLLRREDRDEALPGASYSPCVSHIKQLSTGMAIYISDYDDVMPPDANFKASIMPYVKNTHIFACPDTHIEFAINDAVLGIDTNDLLDPTGSVMLYEGYQKALSGPHGGKSSVSFMDTSARMIEASAPPNFAIKLAPKKPITSEKPKK